MPDTNRLTTKEQWTRQRDDFEFKKHGQHPVKELIHQYIPANEKGTCLEIGSFPGPFLTVFGDLGYSLNGIDFNPANAHALPDWLKREGYKVNEFVSEDYFNYHTNSRYDVVGSFGFIEHFIDYEAVIASHAKLVEESGYLIVTTPNFRGSIQRWLHGTYDKYNLSLHNLESMQPARWKKQLEEAGFEVLFAGYLGGFQFWRGHESLQGLKKISLWVIWRIISRLNKLLWFESAACSAYCGIVAKRKTIS